MPEAPDIPLADAIKRLRDELIGAAQEGVGKDVRFRLGPVKLDLEVAATNTGGGEVGIKFWLVSIGGKAARIRLRAGNGRRPTLQAFQVAATAVGITEASRPCSSGNPHSTAARSLS